MMYGLLALGVVVEALLFTQLTIAGVVPAITILALVVIGRSADVYEMIALALGAGYFMDTVRSGYAPFWTISFVATVIITTLELRRDRSQSYMVRTYQVFMASVLFGYAVSVLPFSQAGSVLSVVWVANMLLFLLVQSVIGYVAIRLWQKYGNKVRA